MVAGRFWDEQIEIGITLTKMRIKHLEKHGDGDTVMKEKRILVQQERHKQLLKESRL